MQKQNRVKYTGLYGSWYAMKQRCGNSNHKAYHNYGGRGITYDKGWESFENFKKDMGGSYKSGLTLDRINNNDSYYKQNCRWATRKQQCNNMRKNVFIKYNGIKMTTGEWAKRLGIKECTLKSRRIRGWSLKRMMSPKLERPCKLLIN